MIQEEGLDQRNGKIAEICVDLQRMCDVLTEPVLLKEMSSSAMSALNSQVEEDMRRNDGGMSAIESKITHQRTHSETQVYGTHKRRSDICRRVA